MIKLVLEGGSEFGGQMADPDRKALELAGGLQAKVVIIPAAAAPDLNHHRAGENGRRWFQRLGAEQVAISGLIDRESANQPDISAELRGAQLIYLLGGFPGYLAETLRSSLAWEAIQEALHTGAVVSGSSAGAMVLCEYLYDPGQESVVPGLGLVKGTCFIPHLNSFGTSWVDQLSALLPGHTLLGVDEQTGIVIDGNQCQVMGAGRAVIYRDELAHVYHSGDMIPESDQFFR